MKQWIYYVLLPFGVLFASHVWAQKPAGEGTNNIKDDVQVDVKSVKINADGDTLSVELFLISYQMDPREFKLNTYATQIVDKGGQQHLFSSIEMGRVLVRLADRQNYLNYLLEEDFPVPLRIKVGDWQSRKPLKMRLVFEDSTEEGRFITQEVDLL